MLSHEQFTGLLTSYWWLPVILLAIWNYPTTIRIFGLVTVPNNQIGIVDKSFVIFGMNRTLPGGSVIALKGEAGIQADVLSPGLHFFYWPWQYSVKMVNFWDVPQGHVGVVEAIDGKAITAGRVLANYVDCDSYQNARTFLEKGGERGPQAAVMPPGRYQIHNTLFRVRNEPAKTISNDCVGVVTVKEGRPLPTGEIAGPEVAGHSMFQVPQKFLDGQGCKGLQEQVVLSGLYYHNPNFVSVEEHPMTEVPIAHVGVVISYVGKPGVDVTGDSFKHGNLVNKGEKGVWVEPLDPGKYPINPRTHRVESVPTANIVLNWATGKTEAHKLDANLSTIKVRSSDGFNFTLDVSQIIHIPRSEAPKVIARFGDVKNLVTQVLEPTIGNYFRNAAQSSGVIDFVYNRQARQTEARKAICDALKAYNIEGVDTLIGDIDPPAALMKTLTDRKIAEQEKVTYETQRLAEETRKELQQATALANTQATVVDAERRVQIAKYDAESATNKAEGEARAKKLNAEADANVLKVVGDAEAGKTLAVGNAEAEVIEKKTKAIGQESYARIEIAKHLALAKNKFVSDITVGGAAGGGSVGDALLASMLMEMRKDKAAA